MRQPSLHITQKHLNNLIDIWFDKFKIGTPSELLAEYLLKEGKKYSLRHRSILASSKTEARVNNIKASPKMIAYQFSKILQMWRVKAKHRNIQMITEKDGFQWNFLLIASGLAWQFCKDYKVKSIKNGFSDYINLGMQMMNHHFGINKFKTYDQKIRESYEALLMIEADVNEAYTTVIYDLYEQKMFEKTGQKLDYKTNPNEYRFFVEASVITKELGIHPKHYLIAQFEQLDFTNGYPTPNQLSTFKAKERALRWVTEHNIRIMHRETKKTQAQEDWLKKYGQ